MNVELGGYHVGDIEVACAFDVAKGKVGKDVAEAIAAEPNNTHRFADVPADGRARPARARRSTGSATICADEIEESRRTGGRRRRGAARQPHGRAGLLPAGRLGEGDRVWYAEQALEAGCAFVNCIPVFIASHPEWRKRFAERGLPLIGDDIKSQVGATIVHRMLANLFRERGVRLDRTYQLNFGGNTDFLNMLERERLESKKISKTGSVTSQLDVPLAPGDIHVGPSDHVPWLHDRKVVPTSGWRAPPSAACRSTSN